jgi:hypothetical protein
MNNILEPIHYNGGVIWVDNNPVKGDTCYLTMDFHERIEVWNGIESWDSCKKVVAQSPNLSIHNIPYVEVEEDDWSDYKQKDFSKFWLHENDKQQCTTSYAQKIYNKGYKAASAKKYTEEDIEKAFIAGRSFQQGEESEYYGGGENEYPNFKTFIQSLQPKIKKITIFADNNGNPIIVNGFVKVKNIEYEKM